MFRSAVSGVQLLPQPGKPKPTHMFDYSSAQLIRTQLYKLYLIVISYTSSHTRYPPPLLTQLHNLWIQTQLYSYKLSYVLT